MKQLKKLKILKKQLLGYKQVIDLTVKDTANYVSTNGIINHNSGIQYAGSVTLNLASIAKLTDKENDKAAAQNIGAETVKKNGVLITAWPDKSRFCIPHKVKFQIPYYKAPSPYVGLEEYLNWDNAGIMQGKCYTEAEFMKLSPADQQEASKYEFEYQGEKRYALPKKTMTKGVGIVCKHLGRAVEFPKEFYSSTTFTPEFLKYINENIIHPLFQLPSRDSFADLEDIKEDVSEAINQGNENLNQDNIENNE